MRPHALTSQRRLGRVAIVPLKIVQFLALIGALIANLALALLLRGRRAPFALALFAFLCIALTLVVFFIWTYPANVATNNWTMIPDNWEQLRRDWEYSHAANAVVTFAALCSVTLSVLTTRERTPSGGVGVASGERPH